MDHQVVITGLGPVTSVGVGVDALWESLCAARSGVCDRVVPVDVGCEVTIPIASMPAVENFPAVQPYIAQASDMDCGPYRDLAYAMLAAEMALADAGITYDRQDNRIGVIQAFEAPGVEYTVAKLFGMMTSLLAGGPPPPGGKPPSVYDALAPSFYNMQPFLYVHLLGKALGLHGMSSSVHNACSSGAYAIDLAALAIRENRADVMIVVGGEAFDTAVRLEWFRRLGLYATAGEMIPFDLTPSGFYVGEGGAAIVLESEKHARDRGASVYAKYLGGSFAQQSWKQTIPDVRSDRLAKLSGEALDRAGCDPEDVDLVVPHGAATLLSDCYEAQAMAFAFGDSGSVKQPVVTVFKPVVGHMLAASGIIDTICTLLAVKHQCVPPAPFVDVPVMPLTLPLVTELSKQRVDTVLKLSTGFTGHDAALVFASPGE